MKSRVTENENFLPCPSCTACPGRLQWRKQKDMSSKETPGSGHCWVPGPPHLSQGWTGPLLPGCSRPVLRQAHGSPCTDTASLTGFGLRTGGGAGTPLRPLQSPDQQLCVAHSSLLCMALGGRIQVRFYKYRAQSRENMSPTGQASRTRRPALFVFHSPTGCQRDGARGRWEAAAMTQLTDCSTPTRPEQRSWASRFTCPSLTLPLCQMGSKRTLPCPVAGQIKWSRSATAQGSLLKAGSQAGREGEVVSSPAARVGRRSLVLNAPRNGS